MNDSVYKGRLEGLHIAFTYAVSTEAVNEAVVRHNCDPAAAHILGRAITGTVLAAAILPEHHRLNACWRYQGALRTLVVDAGQDGTVRGFISPPHLSIYGDAHDGLYGEVGEMQVITSGKNGAIANSGTTPISLHDVVNDLAYHYCISDQVETGLTAMIGFAPDTKHPVRLSQGWMIQALPGTDLKRFDRLRQRMTDSGFRELLAHESAADGFVEQLADALAGSEAGFQGIQARTCPAPRFQCTCSREKMVPVIRSLPIPERIELVKKNEPVRVQCQFCSEHYELTIEECSAAWNRNNN
jgi:molecular chaperone Hsp33